MFDQIEALRALAETGTTARAAARLRITQSAVSKRLAALEAGLRSTLVEKRGRNLVLTEAGSRLLNDLEPHLGAIRARLVNAASSTSRVRLAASESLLASWLPGALAAARTAANVNLELHAHRGPLVLERVRSGHADVGVVVSRGEVDLDYLSLVDEPMWLVSSGRCPPLIPDSAPLDVWTIEAASLTGAWLDHALSRHPWPLRPVGRIESFSSAVQLARAGFGPALVPAGIARAMGVPAGEALAVPGLLRPLAAVFTATAGRRPPVAALLSALAAGAPSLACPA